jgi:hypothetical protein
MPGALAAMNDATAVSDRETFSCHGTSFRLAGIVEGFPAYAF